jgi:general stress protein 26
MDSINKNQPEGNRENFQGRKAVDKIQAIVKKAENCFFCTNDASGKSWGTRPMNVRKVDEQGRLWFLIANDSQTAKELGLDSRVRLFFQGSPHSGFLVLDGRASFSNERARLEELWEPVIKTWFTGGVDDPRIAVVSVVPSAGYYWDTKHGNAVAGAKMVIGAALGKTLDDSIEGTLNL